MRGVVMSETCLALKLGMFGLGQPPGQGCCCYMYHHAYCRTAPSIVDTHAKGIELCVVSSSVVMYCVAMLNDNTALLPASMAAVMLFISLDCFVSQMDFLCCK